MEYGTEEFWARTVQADKIEDAIKIQAEQEHDDISLQDRINNIKESLNAYTIFDTDFPDMGQQLWMSPFDERTAELTNMKIEPRFMKP